MSNVFKVLLLSITLFLTVAMDASALIITRMGGVPHEVVVVSPPHVSVATALVAPPPKETIIIPAGSIQGSVSCKVTPTVFINGVWKEEHRVCHYKGAGGSGTWISGFWECRAFRLQPVACLNWRWVSSQLIPKTIIVKN